MSQSEINQTIGQVPINNVTVFIQMVWALVALMINSTGPALIAYQLLFKESPLGWPLVIFASFTVLMGFVLVHMMLTPKKAGQSQELDKSRGNV